LAERVATISTRPSTGSRGRRSGVRDRGRPRRLLAPRLRHAALDRNGPGGGLVTLRSHAQPSGRMCTPTAGSCHRRSRTHLDPESKATPREFQPASMETRAGRVRGHVRNKARGSGEAVVRVVVIVRLPDVDAVSWDCPSTARVEERPGEGHEPRVLPTAVVGTGIDRELPAGTGSPCPSNHGPTGFVALPTQSLEPTAMRMTSAIHVRRFTWRSQTGGRPIPGGSEARISRILTAKGREALPYLRRKVASGSSWR
jgi:hypothetical protein